jgi:CMP-N-acetylneuraminic acid synthetase
MCETIAIIPARGGSKSILRKNLKLLDGVPLIAHSILAAKSASLIDNVYVSTEDVEIAEVAFKYGAQVIVRPTELASDIATSEDTLFHALKQLEEANKKVERLVFLQCTTPLILSEDLDGAIKLMEQDSADCVFSAVPSHYFIWEENENEGAVAINHPSGARQMRQKLPKQFVESGAFYVLKVEGFKKSQYRFFGRTRIFETPPERSLEIDNLLDLVLCEAIFRERRRQDTA